MRRIGFDILELERVPEQRREGGESAVDGRLGELSAKQLILDFEQVATTNVADRLVSVPRQVREDVALEALSVGLLSPRMPRKTPVQSSRKSRRLGVHAGSPPPRFSVIDGLLARLTRFTLGAEPARLPGPSRSTYIARHRPELLSLTGSRVRASPSRLRRRGSADSRFVLLHAVRSFVRCRWMKPSTSSSVNRTWLPILTAGRSPALTRRSIVSTDTPK